MNLQNRITYWYGWDFYSEEEKRSLPSPFDRDNSNVHWLIEDASRAIPYLRSDSSREFKYFPDSPITKERVKDIWGDNHDIEYQLSETLRKVIYHVLRYGEALFEIVPEIHEEEVFNFGFVEVYNFTVIRDGDDVYQLQPGRGEKSQLKKIPAERLFIFKLPDALDKKIRDVIRRLGDINNEAFYALTLERIKDRNANNIDIAARRFAEKTTIAMITREIGWNVRGLINDHCSLAYNYERQLRWNSFLCELREEVLKGINTLLIKGHQLLTNKKDLEAIQISYNLAPSIAELEMMKSELRKGKLNLNSFWEKSSPRVIE